MSEFIEKYKITTQIVIVGCIGMFAATVIHPVAGIIAGISVGLGFVVDNNR
jgi:hypothetical protein